MPVSGIISHSGNQRKMRPVFGVQRRIFQLRGGSQEFVLKHLQGRLRRMAPQPRRQGAHPQHFFVSAIHGCKTRPPDARSAFNRMVTMTAPI